MGLLRLLLALSVLSSHSGEDKLFLFKEASAVLSFFVISGFYMAFILEGKYKSKIDFYISRALRIFPIYWIALLLTILLGFVKIQLHLGGDENAIIHYLHYSSYLSGNEVVTEGINFIFRNLSLIITKDYFSLKDNVAPGYLILYQGWSLQIELLFYLLIPFILKIKKNFLSFAGLYFIFFYGILAPSNLIPANTLTYRLLDYILYFLLGICSYKYIYKYIMDIKPNRLYYIIFFATLFYVILYRLIPGRIVEQSFPITLMYYLPFSMFLPFIFSLTKNNKLDRFIGELSYPIFISHLIFVKILLSLPHPKIPLFNSVIVAITTILFSILVVKFIQQPIDRFRHRLRVKKL